MAKPSLLRGDWVTPAAAIFLSWALLCGHFTTAAFAEGDGRVSASPSSGAIKPTEGAVADDKQTPKAVEESKPAPKAVEDSKPAPKAVEESKPAPKAVEESKPAPKAVEESKPAPKAVEESKPAPKAVEENKPAPKAVEESKPAPKAVEESKPAPKAVEESKPAPKAVEESKPAPKAVEESKPAPKAVEESKPAPKAVEESKPAPKAVEESKPAPKAVEESKPAPKAVEENKPAPKAVEESKPAPKVGEEEKSPPKIASEHKPRAPATEWSTKQVEKPKDGQAGPDSPGDLAVRASTVDAVYQISWLGAHIGDFTIKSSITARQYSLEASAALSVFFGAFTWQGATSSSGQMTANGPVPQNYSFRYATADRRESVELRFQKRMVQDISINPPQYPGARSVPITAAHLQNVVDPLSAIVLLSQARLNNKGEACNKRLPIFDGKLRFDLVLSPKGMRTVRSGGKLNGTAYVCSVSYVPIAGHRMGKNGENDYAVGNTGIEVWLVPVPEAGLIVPYYIHVPTPAGTASMVTAKFDVQTPTGRHALAD